MEISPAPARLVLDFPRGLPGFEAHRQFYLVEEAPPVVFLQSMGPQSVCFHAIPVSIVDPEYQLGITEDDLCLLGLDPSHQPKEGVLCFAILSVSNGCAVTANLLAPVVVNVATRVAVQAVRSDARYSHQHMVAVFSSAGSPECL
jgi:flagellar assembly factor FliW